MRGLLLFLVGALSASVLVFLVASDFFSSWQGDVRQRRDDEGASRIVVTIEDERPSGGVFQRSWPGDLARELSLPAATRKSRYALHFLVQNKGEWQTHPTTSPQSLGSAVIVLVLLVAVRNMAVSGVPWSFAPRERYHATQLVPSGQAAPVSGSGRSPGKQGPPPSRPRVGRGKR